MTHLRTAPAEFRHADTLDRDRMIHVKTASDWVGTQHLLDEVNSLRGIGHPGIVELLDFVQDEERPDGAVITRYAGATTMADHPWLDIEHHLEVLIAAAYTLGDLHDMGWSHGRPTADHWIVTNDGRPILCSFGSARRVAHPDAEDAQRDVRLFAVSAATALNVHRPSRRSRRIVDVLRRANKMTATQLADELAGLSKTTQNPRQRARPTTPRPMRYARRLRESVVARHVAAGVLFGLTAAILRTHPPQARSGPVAQFALTALHAAALIAALYGLLTVIVSLAAWSTSNEHLNAIAHRMAPSWVRRVLLGVGTVGLATSLAGSWLTPTQTPVGLPNRAPLAAPVTAPATTVPPTVAPTTVPPTVAPTTTAPTVAPTTTLRFGTTTPAPPVVSSPGDADPSPAPPAAPDTHVVKPGDHFWNIAERTTTRRLGRAPTTDETAAYWLGLVDTNRDRLTDPDDPDLLVVGQVIVLPPGTGASPSS